MRYTTEFKVDPYIITNEERERYIESCKQRSDYDLGALIHKIVGYTGPIGYEGDRYKLEIQAFNQIDWDDFKFTLMQYIRSSTPLGGIISELIYKLETIGEVPDTPVEQAISTKQPI